MLGFVQSWLKPASHPIGVDFGTDTLRMAQVEPVNGDFKLVAAASADVPPHVRHEPSARGPSAGACHAAACDAKTERMLVPSPGGVACGRRG